MTLRYELHELIRIPFKYELHEFKTNYIKIRIPGSSRGIGTGRDEFKNPSRSRILGRDPCCIIYVLSFSLKVRITQI